MSHTPGPWKVDEDGFVWGCCPGPAFMKTAHFLVAEVRGWGYLQYRADGEQVQAANARLIAAAPEMYEALEELRDKVWRIIDLHRDSEARAEANMALERANAALAKVRGDEGEENA